MSLRKAVHAYHLVLILQVVREVYLPESGLWLADYPFVDRNAFLDLSLAVERARQQQTVQQPSQPFDEGGGPSAVGWDYEV